MKRFLVHLVIVLFSTTTIISATSNKTIESDMTCRSMTNVVITTEDGNNFSIIYPSSPYVSSNGCVSILPGECLVIEFDRKDGQPVNPKRVKTKTKGKDAIEIEFVYRDKTPMLIRRNECSQIITMKCRYQNVKDRMFYKTGLNPTKPEMSSYDTWPPIVAKVILFDFKYWDDYDKAFEHGR